MNRLLPNFFRPHNDHPAGSAAAESLNGRCAACTNRKSSTPNVKRRNVFCQRVPLTAAVSS